MTPRDDCARCMLEQIHSTFVVIAHRRSIERPTLSAVPLIRAFHVKRVPIDERGRRLPGGIELGGEAGVEFLR